MSDEKSVRDSAEDPYANRCVVCQRLAGDHSESQHASCVDSYRGRGPRSAEDSPLDPCGVEGCDCHVRVAAQTCGREIFGMPGSVDVCTLPAGHDGMHRHQPKEAQMDLTDARARLASMATDKGETWDLSPRDQEAIRIVLATDNVDEDDRSLAYSERSAEWRAGYDEAEAVYHAKQVEMRRERRVLRGRGSSNASHQCSVPSCGAPCDPPTCAKHRTGSDVLAKWDAEEASPSPLVDPGETADLETVGTVYRNGVRDGRREAIASSSAVPSDMGRAVSWLQKWVYSGDDGPNLNTLLAALLADVRRETIEACANVASIPVLRDEPHRIVRNISNLATMSAETIAKLAEKKP